LLIELCNPPQAKDYIILTTGLHMLHISTNQTIKKYRGIIMKKISWKLIAAFVCSSFLSGTAQAVLIDFESFPGMDNFPGTAIPSTSQISDQFLNSDGVLFSSHNSPFIAAVNLGTGHATSGVIGVGGSTGIGELTYAGYFFKATFYDPTNPLIKAVTDFVSIRTDLLAINQLLRLEAYDVNGNQLWIDQQVDIGGNLFSATVSGIHSVAFFGETTTALDDFSFNAVTPANVPLPPAVWLFGTGFLGLMGFTRKNKFHACS